MALFIVAASLSIVVASLFVVTVGLFIDTQANECPCPIIQSLANLLMSVLVRK